MGLEEGGGEEKDLWTHEPVERAAVPGCCLPHGEHALSELATLLMCLLTKILGFGTVLLEMALNQSHRTHIFHKNFSKVFFCDELCLSGCKFLSGGVSGLG